MENEIDLRELLQVLWRGRYFILAVTAAFAAAAVFYVYFLVTPTYQYAALLDLSPFEVNGEEIIALVEQNQVISEAVKGLVEDPDALAKSAQVTVLPDTEFVLQIKVEYSDPEICFNSAKKIGLAVIETVSDYCFTQIKLEKERNEKLLARFDDAAAEYLLSRDVQIAELLEEDPVYKRILEEKAECLVNLEYIDYKIKELMELPLVDTDLWISGQTDTAYPVSVSKKLYLAAAVLLGLMLSILIVFLRHYLGGTGVAASRNGLNGPAK